jgi:hypothetical protein
MTPPRSSLHVDYLQEVMSQRPPTPNAPTALWFKGEIVVYWRTEGTWAARVFGRPNLLPVTPELAAAFEADQSREQRKLDEPE